MRDVELRRWIAGSWTLVLGLLGLGVYWMFRLPTVGKGGIFLAVGATLMPLFWEKIGVVGKMSWIAMLFLLLAVEYRAIDEEHRKNDLAQQTALKAIGDGFTGVLTDQRNGFAGLIQQSQAAFAKTTEQASAQFDATMKKAQVGIDAITGGDSFVVVFPKTDEPPTVTSLPLTISACIKCQDSIPNATVLVRQNGTPVESNAKIYSGTVDPGFATVLSDYKIAVSPTNETDFLVSVFARNKTTTELLRVRLNPTSQAWEFSDRVERLERLPHRNPKTKMAEGAKFKILEDQLTCPPFLVQG
ncbi:MAG: hypothetical protein WA254_07950 [Candidatus Sulfotelmatobacter sp.]